MDGVEEELERRNKFLNSLIIQKKKKDWLKIMVRASDMPLPLQNHAFTTARDIIHSMSRAKIDTKHLALSLKKNEYGYFVGLCYLYIMVYITVYIMYTWHNDFDSTYGPTWHCVVGTCFGSYVTHSLGGFLYFSIDKLYVLLFKTSVEPLDR